MINFVKHLFPLPLVFIFILALLIRLVGLSTLPNGVFTDEIVSGYVGRFILETGKDLYGNQYPLLYFNKFGDYRVILPMYITGLTTYVFGNSIFSLRFPPAFFGAITVVSLYWLLMRLTKQKLFALSGAFLLAIMPWHIVLSRAQSEGIMGLMLLITALALFITPTKKQSIMAILLGILTFFFYPAFRVITPLVFWLFLFFTTHKRTRTQLSAPLILTVIALFILITPFGGGRLAQTSLFSDPDITAAIQAQNSNYAQAHGHNNVLITRIFHNKVTGYAREFTFQFLSYLSPSFLFLDGGLPDRYRVPLSGLITLTAGGLIIISLLAKKAPTTVVALAIGMAGISILPAAVTTDDIPNIHRALVLTIPLAILGGFGLASLFQHKKRIYLLTGLGVLLLLCIETITFIHHYVYLSPSYKSVLRGDGQWEAAAKIIELSTSYDVVYTTNFEDLAVYVLYRMNRYDKEFAGSFQPGVLTIPKVGNIHFITDVCPRINSIANSSGKTALIVNGECANSYEGTTELDKVIRRDQTVAFKILEM